MTKKEKYDEIKKFHEPTIKRYCEENNVFKHSLLTRFSYAYKGEKIVAIFRDDLKLETDVFVEFTDNQNEPEDSNRTLYYWPFNPFYKDDYDLVNTNPKNPYYVIPFSEFNVVPKTNIIKAQPESGGLKITSLDTDDVKFTKPKAQEIDRSDPEAYRKTLMASSAKAKTVNVEKEKEQHQNKMLEDAPFKDLTVRDLAAMITRKPVSNKDWLNDILKNY